MKTLKKILIFLLVIAGVAMVGIVGNEELGDEEEIINAKPCIVSKQNAGMVCGSQL